MKKIIITMLILMNFVSVNATSNTPTYKIIANSNNEKDIEEMYDTKDQLIKDFASWAKGVDDKDQVLADHTKEYNAKFYNGEYVITLGNGKGKTITGKLQTNYCGSSKDIEKKSFIEELLS